jgi:isocitrate/isopropylmalate dehydrogenase
MRSYRIAAMGGDGIGPEVISAGVEVLKACAGRDGGFALDVTDFDWGSDYYRKHGVMMPADGADQLRAFDAILFGAVGAPDIPDHVTLWGLRLAICQPLDQYANVRPTRVLPGITSPLRAVSGPELDWVIVRENSEGEYPASAAAPPGPADRGRDRRLRHDARRRAAHHALRLPPGAVPPEQAADRRHQVQRAAPRHGDVGRDRGPRSRRSSRTSPGTRCWWTP